MARKIQTVSLLLSSNHPDADQMICDLLDALEGLDVDNLLALAETAARGKEPEVRAAGRSVLYRRQPEKTLPLLGEAIAAGEVVERQQALRDLAAKHSPQADELIASALVKLQAGEMPEAVRLDIVEAAGSSPSETLKQATQRYFDSLELEEPMRAFHASLEGGDAAAGQRIFFERTQVSCVRCHKINGRGGEVGPDLSKIGKEKMRDYLLEAFILPNKAIAKNFESVVLIDDDGRQHSGIVKEETDSLIKLMDADGKMVEIEKDAIEARRAGKSAMPEDLYKSLTPGDARDLVEYLKSLQ